MKKAILTIFLFFGTCLLGQDLSNIPGMFLDIGYGARPMGMGGAYTAAANDVYSIVWNPAGLANLQNEQASFYYTKQLGLIPYTMAAYAHGSKNSKWSHGASLLVSGDDALRETAIYYGLGYKADRLLKNLNVGINLKYKNATFGQNTNGGEGRITGNALGFGMDLGAIYKIHPKLVSGLVVKNIVDFVTWNSSAMGSYTQNNPIRAVAGLGFFISPEHLITVDFGKSLYLDTKDRLNIGTERTLFNILAIRCGAFQNLEPTANTNYNLGLGINYSQTNITFHLDAAYVIQELENSIRISLTMDF